MKSDLILDVHAMYGAKTLAGTGAGKTFLPKLIEASASVAAQGVIAIDLRKTDLVTASFFRASFKAFRDYGRKHEDFFVVHICTDKASIEEVTAYAQDVGDAFLFADLDENANVVRPFLVGVLDQKQERTLNALAEIGEADAPTLFSSFPEDPPLSTSAAWSNRLAALSQKGLVRERIEGRSKFYWPILKGIQYGL